MAKKTTETKAELLAKIEAGEQAKKDLEALEATTAANQAIETAKAGCLVVACMSCLSGVILFIVMFWRGG